MDSAKEIRDRMKKAIHEKGESITGFCEKNDISKCCFYTEHYPALHVLWIVADKCNVSADWILFGDRKK